MTDRALSEQALIASLRDIRLPAESPGGGLAEFLAALALALLAALVVAGLLRLVSTRRRMTAEPGVAERVAALDGLPEAEQRIALLHLLKTHAPERFAALKPALYRPGEVVDLAHLRAELGRHA